MAPENEFPAAQVLSCILIRCVVWPRAALPRLAPIPCAGAASVTLLVLLNDTATPPADPSTDPPPTFTPSQQAALVDAVNSAATQALGSNPFSQVGIRLEVDPSLSINARNSSLEAYALRRHAGSAVPAVFCVHPDDLSPRRSQVAFVSAIPNDFSVRFS